MNKYSVDYSDLDQELSVDKFYHYAEVKNSLVKVAFDIVKFKDSEGIDGLWQIKATDDGEVIVAMYSDDDIKIASSASTFKTASLKSPWSVLPDHRNSTVHLFYKDEPCLLYTSPSPRD